MTGERIGSDVNHEIVSLLIAIRDGWVPPDVVTKEDYEKYRDNPDIGESYFRAFLAYGCSSGGRRWGGYAWNRRGDDFVRNARNSLLAIRDSLQGANLIVRDYREYRPTGMLIYCDPPYANMSGLVGEECFNVVEFWDTVRLWANHNEVFVTERLHPVIGVEIVDTQERQIITNTSPESRRKVFDEKLCRVIPCRVEVV
jgi:DNA adenine methylase